MVAQFLTFEDIVRSGACAEGVLEACKDAGMYFGNIEETLDAFPDHRRRILFAAGADGDGDGSGSGYGSGYGDGYGIKN